MAWTNRFVNLFRRRELDEEIDEELQFHIDARTRDHIAAGMAPAEARRQAVRGFGGQLQAREKAHDANLFVWLESVRQDLQYAFRSLRGNLGVTTIAVLSLAIGIGANTAIFSVVNAVLLRSFPFKDADRLALVWGADTLRRGELYVSLPNYNDWRKHSRSFEEMTIYRVAEGAVTPEWMQYAWVSENFFDMLGRHPALGHTLAGQERTVVLSHRLWKRRFGGSPGALGQRLNVAGIDFQIIGVMPEDFRFPTRDTQLWIPASTNPRWQDRLRDRNERFGAVLGRLAPRVSLTQARSEMNTIARNIEPDAAGVNIVPLQVQVNGAAVPFMLMVLFGAVMFVLLIACTNVASLLLARGAARSREIALRTALGAGRRRIVRQLLTESVLLSLVAGCLGLPLAILSVRALVAVAPPDIARLDEARVDATVLFFALAVSLLCGILFGLAPALRISQGGKIYVDRYTRRMRGALVVCEFALSVVLLAGAVLLVRSLQAVLAVDPGFKTENVATAELRFPTAMSKPQRVARYREAIERINQLPGVQAAGAISTMFWRGDGGEFGLRAVEGRPPENQNRWTPLTWATISGHYFQALGVPLLRGRLFTDQDRRDSPPVAILNERMARRYWPGEDPIGKRFKGFDERGHNDEWVTVVGLVKDVQSRGLDRSPMGQIFLPPDQGVDETENLVVSAGLGEEQLARDLRRIVHSVDQTGVLVRSSTLVRELEQQTTERRFQTYLLAIFAAIAFLLAGVGIFGTMHYSVAQRTQEIGLRMALGAGRGNVARMVISEGLALAAIGIGMGLAGCLVLMRALDSLLFGVTSTDPASFSAAALLLTAIAALACYLPARRATKVDPMIALRCH
jgi:putative ABC transport system permease protein